MLFQIFKRTKQFNMSKENYLNIFTKNIYLFAVVLISSYFIISLIAKKSIQIILFQSLSTQYEMFFYPFCIFLGTYFCSLFSTNVNLHLYDDFNFVLRFFSCLILCIYILNIQSVKSQSTVILAKRIIKITSLRPLNFCGNINENLVIFYFIIRK